MTFNRKSCRELRSLDPRLPKPKPPFCASQPQSIIVEHIQRVHILVITPKWMYNGKRKRKSVWPTWLTDNPNEAYITCVGQSISDLTQKMHDYFLCRMGPFSGVTSGSLWKKPAFISAVADSSHLKPNQQPSFSSEYLAPCYSDWLIHSLARVKWGGDVVNTWMCYKVLILHPIALISQCKLIIISFSVCGFSRSVCSVMFEVNTVYVKWRKAARLCFCGLALPQMLAMIPLWLKKLKLLKWKY